VAHESRVVVHPGPWTRLPPPKNKVLDLWIGTGSATRPWADHGWEIVGVDIDEKWEDSCDDFIHADILDVTVEDLLDHGPYDFAWASVDCTLFSVAGGFSHWRKEGKYGWPETQEAWEMIKRLHHTLYLLENMGCPWVLENPRGMMRKISIMDRYPRETITYCQYGDFRMKPTDLWGDFPASWIPRPMCRTGWDCHEAAPRGSKTGTQGVPKEERYLVPYALGQSFLAAWLKTPFPRDQLEKWT